MFAVKLKPERPAGGFTCMTMPRTSDECRDQFRVLIREAVAEREAERRRALLTLADHWAELFRTRRTAE